MQNPHPHPRILEIPHPIHLYTSPILLTSSMIFTTHWQLFLIIRISLRIYRAKIWSYYHSRNHYNVSSNFYYNNNNHYRHHNLTCYGNNNNYFAFPNATRQPKGRSVFASLTEVFISKRKDWCRQSLCVTVYWKFKLISLITIWKRLRGSTTQNCLIFPFCFLMLKIKLYVCSNLCENFRQIGQKMKKL